MLTSSMLPTETKYEKPMPASMAQSSTDVHSAPDCEMKPMCPLVGVAAAKLALRWMPGTMNPEAVGAEDPHPRKLRLLARTCSSSLRPASPISRKPAEMMTIPRVPASPSERTNSGTVAEGVQITARSGTCGRLRMSL